MIEGILDTLEKRAKDDTDGINALVKTHNTTAKFRLQHVRTIDVWDLSELPNQMDLPAFLVESRTSSELELKSQGKWKGKHTVRLWYWINARLTEQNRRHLAGMASVIRSWVDTLPGQGTIAEVLPFRIDYAGFRQKPDLLFSYVMTTLQLVERDELAIP